MTWFNMDGAFDSIGIHVSAKRGLKRKGNRCLIQTNKQTNKQRQIEINLRLLMPVLCPTALLFVSFLFTFSTRELTRVALTRRLFEYLYQINVLLILEGEFPNEATYHQSVIQE